MTAAAEDCCPLGDAARSSAASLSAPAYLALMLIALALGCRAPPSPRVSVLLGAAPEALDPRFATSAVAGRLSELIACPLVTIGDDLRPQMLLAESIDTSNDRAYVVNIRPGVLFHNGMPVTADDVRFTLLSMKDPALASPHRARLEQLLDVVVTGPLSATIVLSAARPSFLVDLRGYGILSRAACEPDPASCRMMPVGAGPYRVVEVDPGAEHLVLRAHDRSPFGTVALRELDVRVNKDNSARLLAVLDGSVDVMAADMLPSDIDVIEQARAATVLSGPGVGFTYLALNVRRGPLADARVREAMALALDVDLIVETKLRGRARRTTGLLPMDHWAKDRSPAAPAMRDPDPARAVRLLDDAGVVVGADGWRFHITLSTTADRLRRSLALVYADAWRAIGIDAQVRVRDWAALYADIQLGAFDAFSAKWTPVVDPELLAWVFASARIPTSTTAGGNRSGYRNADVDAALARAANAPDDVRMREYASVERDVAVDVPLIPLWFEDEVLVVGPRVQGLKLSRIASLLPLAQATLRMQAP